MTDFKWMKDTLGEYIEHRRKALGLSQRALAKKAKISHSTLNRIELDIGKPDSATLEKLADALNLPLMKLTEVLQGRKAGEDRHPILTLYNQLPPKDQKVAEEMLRLLVKSYGYVAKIPSKPVEQGN